MRRGGSSIFLPKSDNKTQICGLGLRVQRRSDVQALIRSGSGVSWG
jgi:hypothetical protein